MQDAGNQDSTSRPPVKHDVPAALHPQQSGAEIVAAPAQPRIAGQQMAARLQIADVTDSLALAPRAKRELADAQQVGRGAARETKGGHGLTRRRGKVERPPNASEDVAPGDAAGIALVNSGA